MLHMSPGAGDDERTYGSELDLAAAVMERGLLTLLASHVPAWQDNDLEPEGLQNLAGATDGAYGDGSASRHGLV